MDEQSARDEIRERFEGFMQEMFTWETSPFDADDGESSMELAREALKLIYAKYLTNREGRHTKLQSFSVSSTPEYNPDLELIMNIEVDGNSAVLYTDRDNAGLSYRRVYRWKYVDGCWRLDRAREFSLTSKSWDQVFL